MRCIDSHEIFILKENCLGFFFSRKCIFFFVIYCTQHAFDSWYSVRREGDSSSSFKLQISIDAGQLQLGCGTKLHSYTFHAIYLTTHKQFQLVFYYKIILLLNSCILRSSWFYSPKKIKLYAPARAVWHIRPCAINAARRYYILWIGSINSQRTVLVVVVSS